jgi:hypothetical protein
MKTSIRANATTVASAATNDIDTPVWGSPGGGWGLFAGGGVLTFRALTPTGKPRSGKGEWERSFHPRLYPAFLALTDAGDSPKWAVKVISTLSWYLDHAKKSDGSDGTAATYFRGQIRFRSIERIRLLLDRIPGLDRDIYFRVCGPTDPACKTACEIGWMDKMVWPDGSPILDLDAAPVAQPVPVSATPPVATLDAGPEWTDEEIAATVASLEWDAAPADGYWDEDAGEYLPRCETLDNAALAAILF